MPHFQLVPLEDATRLSGVNSRRQQMLQEHISYINNLSPGQADKLAPSDGETSMAIRRRLTAAAKQLGKEVQSRRHGDAVYFWPKATAHRRGRPPRAR